MWDELAPEVHANGCLTKMDVELFAQACKWAAISRRRSDIEGRQAWALADRVWARFGMAPSDRTRIKIEKVSDDPFEKFLGKAK